MNAKIFCLTSQKSMADEVERLLRDHIFKDIGCLRLEIGDGYSRNPEAREQEYCRLFLRLLKASMMRVDDFAVVVTDGRGRWHYMGGVYNEEPHLLELFAESMPSLFPAVAIMDRMVMLPHTVGDAFRRSRALPWFIKPSHLGGVVLTNFGHTDSLVEGTRQVGLQLRTDIAKLCKRHMLMRKIGTPDFTELSRLLDVHTKYLERHRAEIVPPSARLSARIVSGPARVGRKTRVRIEVHYESDDPLALVVLNVNAPSGTLDEPVSETLSFPDGGSKSTPIEFDLVPMARPYCPLEVIFAIDERHASSSSAPFLLILDVQ